MSEDVVDEITNPTDPTKKIHVGEEPETFAEATESNNR